MTVDALLGTWRLVRGEVRGADPTLAVTFDHGLLYYSASGQVAAQCGVARGSPDHALRRAVGDYVAYFGTFRLSEQDGRVLVVHDLEGSNLPGRGGTVLTRRVELLDNGHLRLSDTEGGNSLVMVWERVD